MTRALCHFMYELSYEDFKITRKKARNFKEYFLNKREFLLRPH
jgi:hypothetical protein